MSISTRQTSRTPRDTSATLDLLSASSQGNYSPRGVASNVDGRKTYAFKFITTVIVSGARKERAAILNRNESRAVFIPDTEPGRPET